MMAPQRQTPRSGKTKAQHRGQSRHTVCSTLKSRVKQVTLVNGDRCDICGMAIHGEALEWFGRPAHVVCVDPWASDGWPL